jgi:hypothetical protein
VYFNEEKEQNDIHTAEDEKNEGARTPNPNPNPNDGRTNQHQFPIQLPILEFIFITESFTFHTLFTGRSFVSI